MGPCWAALCSGGLCSPFRDATLHFRISPKDRYTKPRPIAKGDPSCRNEFD